MQQLSQSPLADSSSFSRIVQLWHIFFRYIIKFSPLLLIAVACYLMCAYIFFRVDPESVRNTWITNSYAPLILLSAVGHFCFFSVVLMHFRRGALVTAVLSLSLFVKLQGLFQDNIFLSLALVATFIEALFITLEFFWKRWKLQHKQVAQAERHSDISSENLSKPHQATSQSEQTSSRRRGRQRKHHFFGQ